jgi:hypothetical protein
MDWQNYTQKQNITYLIDIRCLQNRCWRWNVIVFQCAFSLRCFLAASIRLCTIPSKSPSEFTKAAIWEYCTVDNYIFLHGKISYYTHILVINIMETLVPDCQFQNTSSWNCTNKLAFNGQKLSATYANEADSLFIWWGRSTKYPKTQKESILSNIKEDKFAMHRLLVCYIEHIY